MSCTYMCMYCDKVLLTDHNFILSFFVQLQQNLYQDQVKQTTWFLATMETTRVTLSVTLTRT